MNVSGRRFTAAVAAAAFVSLSALSAAGGGVSQATPPRNLESPRVVGAPHEGVTLRVARGEWAGTRPLTFRFQWVRCSSSLSNCQNIAGATADRFGLTSADVGRRLVVSITVSNAAGTTSTQAASAVIQPPGPPPSNTSAPSVSGTAQQGQTLTGNPGGWSGAQPISFEYRWQRCDNRGRSCSNIGGATRTTYALSSADVGQTVRVVVRASNYRGARSASSTPTAVVGAAAPPGPSGQIRLPNGRVSIPVTSVSGSQRLLIERVEFSPNPVRSRSGPLTIRVWVADTRGYLVRDAFVYVRSTPLVTTTRARGRRPAGRLSHAADHAASLVPAPERLQRPVLRPGAQGRRQHSRRSLRAAAGSGPNRLTPLKREVRGARLRPAPPLSRRCPWPCRPRRRPCPGPCRRRLQPRSARCRPRLRPASFVLSAASPAASVPWLNQPLIVSIRPIRDSFVGAPAIRAHVRVDRY